MMKKENHPVEVVVPPTIQVAETFLLQKIRKVFLLPTPAQGLCVMYIYLHY